MNIEKPSSKCPISWKLIGTKVYLINIGSQKASIRSGIGITVINPDT